MRTRSLLLLLYLAATACAGMTVKQVDPNNDAKYDGIRYYGSSLYLLVHTDNAGGLTADPVYLPDPAKLMSAHPYAYLSSNSGSMEFTNGVLTSSETEVDATVVPKAVLTALQAVAVAAVGAANTTTQEKNSPTVPLPTIFKIEVSGGHAQLIGENGPLPAAVNIQGIHRPTEGGQ